MKYIAKMVTMSRFRNITDKLKPFVSFHSQLENVKITEEDKIVILQIEGTESYFPIFLKTNPTIEQIEDKLAKQDTKLNTETKKLLMRYLGD